MSAFYEIHDSILEDITWRNSALELTLDGFCTLSNDTKPLACGSQKLLLRIEDAQMTGDVVEPPLWLLDGHFTCESEDSNERDRGFGNIAASLGCATLPHLHLFGMNESLQVYPTFDIRGQSMTLQKISVVEWRTEHEAIIQQPSSKVLGAGAFASGVSDLESDKAHS